MATKSMLIILMMTIISRCYSLQSCIRNKTYSNVDIYCTTSNNEKVNLIEIEKSESRIIIECCTDDKPILLNLNTTFPETINKTFSNITLKNCTLPQHQSFGALFRYLGIGDGNLKFEFEAKNVGSSLRGRFSSGFKNVVILNLSSNGITQLDDDVFKSLSNLATLDLSNNQISELSKNVFESLVNLVTLNLSDNKLTFLYEGMFKHQTQLDTLTLDYNQIKNLTSEVFEGLRSLKKLNLDFNSIQIQLTDDVFNNIPKLSEISFGGFNTQIPYNIFTNNSELKCIFLQKAKLTGLNVTGLEELSMKYIHLMNITGISNITAIALTDSRIQSLPHNSFENSSGMTHINLSSNKLYKLEDGLFNGLHELKKLDLSRNNLSSISEFIFRHLQSLLEIDLSDNNLKTIHRNAFANTTELQILNLMNNQLTQSPFINDLNKLENLNLRNNILTKMPSDLANLTGLKLKVLDLGFNKIKSLNFSELRNFDIDLNSLHLNDNPLECDCNMHSFLSATDQNKLATVFSYNCKIDHFYLKTCVNKPYLPPYSSSAQCPSECNCEKMEDGTESNFWIIISCESKGLTSLQEIGFENATSIQLAISNKNLMELPKLPSHSRVTFIQASHNKISNIVTENLPAKLRVLDVSYNNIQRISANVLDYIKRLEVVFLKENPFKCDCSDEMTNFIKFVSAPVTDLQGAKCDSTNELSIKTMGDYCSQRAFIRNLIIVIVLAILIMIVSFVYYKYQQVIKAWLYAHNFRLWWIDEEHLDKDKVYDAFISYSHLDEAFVQYLVETLENSSPPFKLCVHVRDFTPGELIEQSIIQSVETSRRTIIILSKNFLESNWTKHEFHRAYEKSISDKRNRLIIVKFGDISDTTESDPIIKTYISTRTYIESNDRWFWEKLRYMLPHKTN